MLQIWVMERFIICEYVIWFYTYIKYEKGGLVI